MYRTLMEHYGPQDWWPGDSPLEVVVGAILTQNTAWPNVERAIHRLKEAQVLTLERLEKIDERELAELIRPSGAHRVKARRIKAAIHWFSSRHGGDIVKALSG